MQEKQYQEEYVEVNIKDLFWSVLRHWRVLLAALLIGGVLLGAYKGYKELKVIRDADEVKARQEAYQEEVLKYEKQKSQLESDLKNLRDSQNQQQYYKDHALMLQMDQYNVRIISASYFMEISQQADMDKEWVINYGQALVRRYQAALGQLDLDKLIATAEQPDLTVTNPAGSSRKLLETFTDDKVSVLYVTVRADSEERAAKIYAAVEKTLAEQEMALSGADGRYRLSKISEIRYSDVDAEIGKVQTNFEKSVQSTIDSITDKEKTLSELKAPTNSTPTMKSAIKSAVKYGIIGAVAGLFAAAFIDLVRIVLQDRLNSTDEVTRRYGLPMLGTIAEEAKKKSKLDTYLEKCLGFNSHGSAEAAADYAASNIRFQIKDSSKVLLVGNCRPEKLSALREQLASRLEGIEIIAAGNVNEDPAAVNALRSETAVVCVEEWKKTQHKAIRRELQTVADSGNRNLGFIAVR